MIKVKTKMNPCIGRSRIDGKLYAMGGNWVEVPEGTTLKDIQWIPTHEKKAIHIPKKRIMKVQGSKGNEYVLTYKDGKVTCTCPGFKFRRKCKHQELMK